MAKAQSKRVGKRKQVGRIRDKAAAAKESATEEFADIDVEPELEQISFGPLAALVGYRIRRAYGLVFYTFNEMFEPLGIAFGQYSVLALIGLNPGISQMALADASDIDRTTVVPITERFVQLGWVRRTRRREDRRKYSLRVTPAGEAVLIRANALILEHDKRIGSSLSKAERAQLLDLLARVNDERNLDLRPQSAAAPRSKS